MALTPPPTRPARTLPQRPDGILCGVLRNRPLAAALILLCLAGTASGADAATPEPLAVLESGSATLDIDGRRATVPYSLTAAGPRVALEPLVARLGGTLRRGPLGQRHELDVNGTVFVFGPRSGALTSNGTIQRLSQPAEIGDGGLHVPLDLLHWVYTRLMGFDFVWSAGARSLTVTRQPPRSIPMTFDVVSLQGVTTLVFQFPTTPRYRIERSPSRIEIEFIGDRLDVRSPRLFPDDKNVREVRVTPQRILIELAPNTTAQDYSLDRPFRLVFDVLKASAPSLSSTASPQPRQRRDAGVGQKTPRQFGTRGDPPRSEAGLEGAEIGKQVEAAIRLANAHSGGPQALDTPTSQGREDAALGAVQLGALGLQLLQRRGHEEVGNRKHHEAAEGKQQGIHQAEPDGNAQPGRTAAGSFALMDFRF